MSDHRFAKCADLLNAMANPVRLRILVLLLGNELSVGALVNKVGLSQSALSQHLAKLRAQKLVSTRKIGQTVLYSCKADRVASVVATLDGIFDIMNLER